MSTEEPFIVGVGGFESNVGKTTLMCDLLTAFPGWEAIKTTKGHYRSCGKDPHACCVSHLLSDKPIVRSGKGETYASGKDTGRYWDAGASNVHWVIATENQIERGVIQALERVRSRGVLIEGNTFSEYVNLNLMIMVARRSGHTIKNSARRALARSTDVYVSRLDCGEEFEIPSLSAPLKSIVESLPIFTDHNFPRLVAKIYDLSSRLAPETALAGH